MIDDTHIPARRSWVASANGHADFPIQNLPFGIFTPSGSTPRGGVAIGDEIFDFRAAHEAGLFHGPASSIVTSGSDVRRPNGQRKPASETVPSFGPSRSLDYELELGVWIGPGNALGQPIPIAQAPDHIAGFCLLNDWSARDIQGWEYQPLGPFLGQSFLKHTSPLVGTPTALG